MKTRAVIRYGWMVVAFGAAACSKENDIYCDTSAECPPQQACAIDRHACTASALTLDSTGFLVEETRWWSPVSGPTLRGVVNATGIDTIRVFVDGAPVGRAADVVDDQWSVRLPDNTIVAADKPVRVVLTGSEGAIEIIQSFALDDSTPNAAFASTSIIDEKLDGLTFIDSEPTHTHVADMLMLEPEACTSFSKFGYLMDAAPPAYGKENVRNPLIWRVTGNVPIALDTVASRYRIEGVAGEVVKDWAPLPTTAVKGDFNLEFPITRAEVGSTQGGIRLQVEVVDWAGRKKSVSACWTQTIMAPPLDSTLLKISTNGPRGLGGWTLAASPFSTLINGTEPVHVFESTVVNGTSEAVTIDFMLPSVSAAYARTGMTKDRSFTTAVVLLNCGTTAAPITTGQCSQRRRLSDVPTSTNGDLLIGDWLIRVVDPQTGAASGLCLAASASSVRCGLPGRTAAPPSSVVVIGALARLPQLAPAPGMIGEYSANGFSYTGLAPLNETSCIDMDDTERVGNTDNYRLRCLETESTFRLTYLTSARISLGNPRFQLGFENLAPAPKQASIMAPPNDRTGSVRNLSFDTGLRL